jgi:hypothetical protein
LGLGWDEDLDLRLVDNSEEKLAINWVHGLALYLDVLMVFWKVPVMAEKKEMYWESGWVPDLVLGSGEDLDSGSGKGSATKMESRSEEGLGRY